MRILVVPILKNRWAYYCHSTLPSTSRLTQFVNWTGKKWENFGKAEPTSWKGKLFKAGNNFMDRMDYEEWFLKGVPIKEDLEHELTKVPVHHPSSIDSSIIRQHLQIAVEHRLPYHKKYMYYSAYWIPASLSFAIVPLIPNIPLAYNAFRLYSNFKAYKGAQHLQYLTSHNCLTFETSSDLDRILEGVQLSSSKDLILPSTITAPFSTTEPIAAHANQKPNLEPLHDDIMGVIDISTLNRIAHECKAPGLEIELKRARFQILSKIVKDRAAKNTLGQLPVEWRNEIETDKK
ncbi:mitochondrial K+-H+ exchange-related-domain-containing protein [Umbelopsis sp. PMI_123]|nr:mitochondrial K+-H+ exchange-related-domain-containing protein [Umbelopsis sp. PMI_123]